MVAVSFVEPSGQTKLINAEIGLSLKDVALRNGVEGIVGLCGGYANCGTCHVYVSEGDLGRLDEPNEAEEMMLEGVCTERRASSRLSCQILVSPELDGLTVTVAPEQM